MSQAPVSYRQGHRQARFLPTPEPVAVTAEDARRLIGTAVEQWLEQAWSGALLTSAPGRPQADLLIDGQECELKTLRLGDPLYLRESQCRRLRSVGGWLCLLRHGGRQMRGTRVQLAERIAAEAEEALAVPAAALRGLPLVHRSDGGCARQPYRRVSARRIANWSYLAHTTGLLRGPDGRPACPVRVADRRRRRIPAPWRQAWTAAERDCAAAFRADLFDWRLEVILVPAPQPRHAEHCIRANVSGRGPGWYARLCDDFGDAGPSRRGTRLNRRNLERLLDRIAAGKLPRSWRSGLLQALLVHLGNAIARGWA